ncbi:hypothetical protein OG204_29835 [Streptomyces sp. NBC_01387]|uniref:hypothetical protein n=1 Tax=unclassified Streptomyces TaxID=2593676 RepID=UPI002024B3F0|nr:MULTISPECIES: hypothetical protein [unclassified Streptomyces]
MSTFNFKGDISGPSNFGDGGKIEIHQHGMSPAEAMRLATQLVQQLRAEGRPALAAEAEVVRGELARAGQGSPVADHGRIRQALETISLGLATGSGGLELVRELGRFVGM